MEKLEKLSDILLQIASLGPVLTDIHIESGRPISIRRACAEWQPYVGRGGKEVIVSLPMIQAFLNGVYHEKEDCTQKNPKWGQRLAKDGSIFPAFCAWNDEGQEIRLRCTVQSQNMGDTIAMMVRPIPKVPSSLEELGLPIQVAQLASTASQGLIVITGPTGCGKSTTIAAMIEQINLTRPVNILTIEEPIEYVYMPKKAIINQRELHFDCPSFDRGVRDALRFVPDVVVVGEIRDKETMEATLRLAESGHLVLTTLHAPTTVSAIRKMIALLDGREAEKHGLLSSLVAIVAQKLLRRMPAEEGEEKLQERRSNVLAYEFLNLKDNSVASKMTSDRLDELEQNLRTNAIPGAGKSMTEVLKMLIEQRKIDGRTGILSCPYAEDRNALQSLVQSMQRGER